MTYRLTVPRARSPPAEAPGGEVSLSRWDNRMASGSFIFAMRYGTCRPSPATIRRSANWLLQCASAAASSRSSAMPDTDASPLTFTIESLQSTTLRLIVQEGDNAPLPIGVPTLLLPGYRVRFVRPANVPLQLVYGNRELEPARYDLVLAARWLVTSPAQEVVPGPEPRTTTNALPAGIIFWSALVAAVVVLLALVGRLVAAKP